MISCLAPCINIYTQLQAENLVFDNTKDLNHHCEHSCSTLFEVFSTAFVKFVTSIDPDQPADLCMFLIHYGISDQGANSVNSDQMGRLCWLTWIRWHVCSG